MCTSPASVSARPYGSQTNSPVVVEASRFTNAPRRTDKPTSDSLGSTGTATPEGGRLTPGTVSESVSPSPRTTPFPPDESSKTQWTPRQTTSAPSEGSPGNYTDPSDTSILQIISGLFRAWMHAPNGSLLQRVCFNPLRCRCPLSLKCWVFPRRMRFPSPCISRGEDP